jgi:hypothetical protein
VVAIAIPRQASELCMTGVRAVRSAEARHKWRERDVARPDLHWLTWPVRPHPSCVSACLPLSRSPRTHPPAMHRAGRP